VCKETLTCAVGDPLEDRGAADRFAIRRGAPAVSSMAVALRWQEVPFRTALWHKDGCYRTAAVAVGSGLQALSSCQLAFRLLRI